jgi:hypothetical protein
MANNELDFYFVVAVEKDGNIQTYKDLPEGMTTDRQASTFDIYKVSKEIVADIEAQLLADRVISGVMNAMAQRDMTFQERIAANLQDRGVEFDASGAKTVEFSAENIELPIEVTEE